MKNNICSVYISQQGIGGKKSTGDDSTATFVSDDTNRESHKSPAFTQKAIPDAVPCHPNSSEDTALLTLVTGCTPYYLSILDPKNPGSSTNPDRFKASCHGPTANCPYADLKNLPRVQPGLEFDWPREFESALNALFVADMHGTGTGNDPRPEYHQIVYLRGPDNVLGVGPHFDYGRVASFMLRVNFELSAVSGKLVFHAHKAVAKKGSTEEVEEEERVDSGYELASRKLITKVEIDRPQGSNQYGISPGPNGSGLFVDSGDGTGILLKHSFEMDERNGQRVIFVADFRYRRIESLHSAIERLKKGPLCIANHLSDKAKAKLQDYIGGRSPRETLEAAMEAANRIRATPISDAIPRCENHGTCGGFALTYSPDDDKINGKYVPLRCHECRKEGDLTRPCRGGCGKNSRRSGHEWCKECGNAGEGYKCSGATCGVLLTSENSSPGANYCRECQSAYKKRKHDSDRSAAVEAGAKLQESGRSRDSLIGYQDMRAIVKAVCECRQEYGTVGVTKEVMTRLLGQAGFPRTLTIKQVQHAWNGKTGKPETYEQYEGSAQDLANEALGDVVEAKCPTCGYEKDIWSFKIDKNQRCNGCKKPGNIGSSFQSDAMLRRHGFLLL